MATWGQGGGGSPNRPQDARKRESALTASSDGATLARSRETIEGKKDKA